MKSRGITATIECNAELDNAGIDARISGNDFQIKKISQRKEARQGAKKADQFAVIYPVWNMDEKRRLLTSRFVKEKGRAVHAHDIEVFNKYFIQLSNGFVVFRANYISRIIMCLSDKADIQRELDIVVNDFLGI